MTQQHGLRSAETKHKPTPAENTHGPPWTHPCKEPLQKERGFFHGTVLLPEGRSHVLGSGETPPPMSTCTSLATALLPLLLGSLIKPSAPLQPSSWICTSFFKQYCATCPGTFCPHGPSCIDRQPQTRVRCACACPGHASTDLKHQGNILVSPG